jgi:DNA repair protein SbcD/Mre11
MKLLHTSDWHLGHQLHGVARDREHAAFLAWLVDACEREQVDAIVISGDVFDGSNPPATAQAAYFGFLADVSARVPGIAVVVIAGNHDSPARLDAPAPLLARLRVHAVGALRDDPVVALRRRGDGAIAAWLAAVPFLRLGDVAHWQASRTEPDASRSDPEVPIRAIYADAVRAARARREPGQALVVTGHLHVTGAEPSTLSERRIVIGGVEAVGGDLFAADVAYVALGHLHKPQRVGRDTVRYAGSPIPLAMNEADYRHQVLVVELDGERARQIRAIEVPRTIELWRVPRRGAASLDDVLAQLAALPPLDDAEPPDLRPLLEVHVRLDRPAPQLRAQVEQAIDGRRPRLVKILVERAGSGDALGDGRPGIALADLAPRDVLIRKWQRDHGGEPPAALLAAFDAVVATVTDEAG